MSRAFIFALTLLLASPALADDARSWTVVPDKSSLTFRAKQMGEFFNGSFDRFTATIAFDPDNLAASKALVDVDVASVNSKDTGRDGSIRSSDWLDATKFPTARFETTSFRKTGDKNFEATANLTIRNVTLPVVLPFQLEIVKDAGGVETATMDGTVTLDRSKFQLGVGALADTSVIANEVPVTVHLVATAAAPKAK